MTKAEWLTASDPTPMLAFLRGKASDRKLRLSLVAAVMASEVPAGRPDLVRLVDLAEKYADGMVGESDFQSAVMDWYTIALEAGRTEEGRRTFDAVAAVHAPLFRSQGLQRLLTMNAFASLRRIAGGQLVAAIRDIFGNPFRPIVFDPTWLTPTVRALAEGVYYRRASAPLPVLADALQDAGCEHPDILAHCRGEGPHVRGCWVIDLILGKA